MGRHRETGERVAIKLMKKRYDTWDECIQLREVKILQKYGHANIRRLMEVIRIGDQLHMVFEYMEGSIYELLIAEYKKTH
jgi:serine/threonine protein kinase